MYAIAGFLIAPSVLRPRLIEAISEKTGCPVSIGGLKVNPFALSITVEDFALLDRDHNAIVSFKELYINFETISLFRRAYTFSRIHLSSPNIYVGIRPDGTSNLEDIKSAQQGQADTTEATPPRVIVQDLDIDSGKVVFEDHARPTPFRAVFDSLGLSLKDFTTLPDEKGEYRFEASTGRNEMVRWKGNFSVIPIRSAGSFELIDIHARRAWEYMQNRVNFEILSGEADFGANYTLDMSKQKMLFEMKNGSLKTRNVVVASLVDSVRAVTLPQLTIGGIRMDYSSKSIEIDSIATKGLVLANALSADGRITLKHMFLPKLEPGEAPPAKKPMEWKVLLKHIACMSTAFHNEDRTTTPTADFDISPADLAVENLQLDKPMPAAFTMKGSINGDGSATATGNVIIDIDNVSVDAALDVVCTNISLLPFQPYVNAYAKAEVKSGAVDFHGKVHFLLKNAKRTIDTDGDVSFANLRVTDAVLQEDFLRCTRVEMKKMSAHQSSNTFSLREIDAFGPYLRSVIGPDRVTNMQHMMGIDTLNADSTAVIAATPKKDTASAKVHMKSSIGKIRIVNGSLKFSDLSLRPNFDVGVEEMKGSISGLSSAVLSRAEVDLEGKVDKYAPAIIKGQINPLSEEAFTDIVMSFHGIELTTFTPYSGRFAGYKIDKGKMSVDLHYKLNKSHLDGENRIILNQLTLGEKVESPDATSLPVKLAIALLKDSHGNIDLDIPVSGDINDPQFRVMPIVIKVFVNVVVKAVTAPFKLLGSLFGGSEEELNFVEFPAGSDSLTVREQTQLSNLAKALTERPGLSLEMRGIAVDTLDREALARQEVFAKIRPPVASEKSVEEFTPQQRSGVLRLYTDSFKDDPKNLVAPPAGGKQEETKEEQELAATRAALAKLLSSAQISDETLRGLANRRADAVKSYLVLKSGIGEERVFLTDVNINAPSKDGLVQMELSLAAK